MPYRFNPHPLFDNFGDSIPKNEARARLGLDPEQSYILFFGFIRDYKGLDLLLHAMARPEIRELPVKLLVAGEYYTDPEPYRAIIRDSRLEDRVVMHDRFIDDSEVASYFCAADLVVQPYKHATQSGVTQIAYHFNKPMVVTNVGGLPELVPDGIVGYVTEPSPDAIASAVVKYFREEKEVIFAQYIEKEKLKFSWGKMAGSILDLYHELK